MQWRRAPSPRMTKANLKKAELRIWRITQKTKSKKVALCLPNVKAVRFYLFVIFCVAMIFSCWGSFQRYVFWLKLILWEGGDENDVVDNEKMIVNLMMMMEEDQIWCSLSNVSESMVKWLLPTGYLHVSNALWMHHTLFALQCTFFKHTLQKRSVILPMHAQKQAGLKCNSSFQDSTSELRTQQIGNVLTHQMENRMYY